MPVSEQFGDRYPAVPTPTAIDELQSTIDDRKKLPPGSHSYVRKLLDGGWTRLLGKLAEEGAELGAELLHGSDERVVSETADVLFHLMVALGLRDIRFEAVEAELARRFGTSGLDEKAARKK